MKCQVFIVPYPMDLTTLHEALVAKGLKPLGQEALAQCGANGCPNKCIALGSLGHFPDGSLSALCRFPEVQGVIHREVGGEDTRVPVVGIPETVMRVRAENFEPGARILVKTE